MLTLPVGGGMLYVQPVYVQSSGDAKYPRLQRVLVSFGDKVGFAPTLEEALNQVFGGSSGAKLDGSATASPAPSASGSSSGSSSSSGSNDSELKQALNDASKAMSDSDAAMKKGDWAAYGEAQKRLEAAVKKALAAEEAQNKGSATPSASASAAASPSANASPNASASASASASR